jgi:hypothetical protein
MYIYTTISEMGPEIEDFGLEVNYPICTATGTKLIASVSCVREVPVFNLQYRSSSGSRDIGENLLWSPYKVLLYIQLLERNSWRQQTV